MVPDGSARRDVEAGATMCVLRTGSASRSGVSAGKSGYTFELKQEWAQELCKSESEGGIKSVTRETINAVHKCGGSRVMQHSVQRQAQYLTSKRGVRISDVGRCGSATALRVQKPSAQTRADDHWLFSHGPGVRRVSEAWWQEQERGKSRQK